jgi:hypothetical protein
MQHNGSGLKQRQQLSTLATDPIVAGTIQTEVEHLMD